MDRPLAQTDQALIQLALRAAQENGLHLRVLRHGDRAEARPDADAIAILTVGRRDVRFAAEIKRTLRPATLGAVIHQLHARPGRPLLVADYVTPTIADALRAQNIEFIDAAGNAYVKEPPLLVFVKGQRPVLEAQAVEPGRAFQPTGLQVLFVLLARPDLVTRTYREIAAAAGVAHGTVGWVMAELPRLGYLAKLRGERRLLKNERLLDQWTEAFVRTLRPRLLMGRFEGDMAILANLHPGPGDDLRVGGEIAAARLTQHLRPATATFYVEALQPRTILDLKLKAAEAGNTDFRRRFWNLPEDRQGLAPLVLVYADLLAIGDARCLETAGLLRERIVARPVQPG